MTGSVGCVNLCRSCAGCVTCDVLPRLHETISGHFTLPTLARVFVARKSAVCAALHVSKFPGKSGHGRGVTWPGPALRRKFGRVTLCDVRCCGQCPSHIPGFNEGVRRRGVSKGSPVGAAVAARETEKVVHVGVVSGDAGGQPIQFGVPRAFPLCAALMATSEQSDERTSLRCARPGDRRVL